jgi:osmotically-inducible protein OsmY
MTIRFKRISVALATIALTMLVGCASTAKTEGTGEYVDDSVITSKTRAALINEANFKSNEVSVTTFKGQVQLSGFVRSQADINRAVEIAAGVAGVTSVKNDMRLK